MEPVFEIDNGNVPGGTVEDILAELSGGKKKPRFVHIYTHAKLNIAASKEAGHRVYDETPFILIKYSSRDDGVSRPVTEADKRQFPREWRKYQDAAEASRDPDVSLLPACTLALAQELRDQGLGKISALLAHADQLDGRFHTLLKQAEAWARLNENMENEDVENDG